MPVVWDIQKHRAAESPAGLGGLFACKALGPAILPRLQPFKPKLEMWVQSSFPRGGKWAEGRLDALSFTVSPSLPLRASGSSRLHGEDANGGPSPARLCTLGPSFVLETSGPTGLSRVCVC